MELGELWSGHRMFISDSIMLTPVHYPANLEDKERDLKWDILLTMLRSSRLYYLRHPDYASASLVSTCVRASCVITSPWKWGPLTRPHVISAGKRWYETVMVVTKGFVTKNCFKENLPTNMVRKKYTKKYIFYKLSFGHFVLLKIKNATKNNSR